MMKVALWAWHVPYLYLLAKALPEVEWLALPTRYNPTGWNETQRPKPANVTLDSVWALADVVLAQTPYDLAELLIAPDDLPVVYLSHNRQELEGVSPERVEHFCKLLVCISSMKATSWRVAGYNERIEIIPPGIPLEWYGGWTGGGGYILTVANGIKRELFDWRMWMGITASVGRPTKLVGEYNDGVRGAVGPARSWEHLKELYRAADVYLNPVRAGETEDAYNLAALEAAACGAPIRNLYGAPPRVEDFPIEAFVARWRRVLEDVCGS